jgi:hypothetical protein
VDSLDEWRIPDLMDFWEEEAIRFGENRWKIKGEGEH